MRYGLDSFFNLGFSWCCFIVASASVAQTDVSLIESYLDRIDRNTDSLPSMLSNIYSDLSSIDSYMSSLDSRVQQLNTTQTAVLSAIRAIDTTLTTQEILVYDSYLTSRLDAFKREAHSDSQTIDDSLADILSVLYEIAYRSDGGVSNSSPVSVYITNSVPVNVVVTNLPPDVYVSVTNDVRPEISITNSIDVTPNITVVVTNLVYGGLETNGIGQLYMPPYVASLESSELYNLFYALYGRYPTEAEMRRFNDLYNFGASFFPLYNASIIGWDDSFLDMYSTFGGNFLDAYLLTLASANDMEITLGDMRYYEYGTREATSILSGISNLVASLSVGDIDTSISKVTTSEGTSYEVNTTTIQAVGDIGAQISESFSVDDVVDKPNTNSIVERRDGTYASQLARITRETVLENVTLDLNTQIESLGNQFSSLLVPSGDSNEFVLDLGTFSLFSISKDISFTLTKPPALYFQLFSFVCVILKGICVYLCLNAVYSKISSEL